MYGFQKHLSDKFPSQINVDATQFCNLACIHCPYVEFSKSSAFSGTHLALDVNKKMVDEVATDGFGVCEYVRYTSNGEPLLHPKIDDILSYACKFSKTKVTLTTNGMRLNDKKSNALLDMGISVIDISIDAFKDETYAKIRKKGVLEKTRTNILSILNKIHKNNYQTKVVVSFVEQPLNKNETKDFENFWKNAGASFVIIRRLHSASGAKEGIKNKIEQNSLQIQRKPCLYPWERLLLNPLGELGYCPSDWYHSSVIGSIKEKTIKELWQSEIMKKLRSAHLNNDFCGFDFCKNCPDWVNTRWPDEGKSYSNMVRDIVPEDLL